MKFYQICLPILFVLGVMVHPQAQIKRVEHDMKTTRSDNSFLNEFSFPSFPLIVSGQSRNFSGRNEIKQTLDSVIQLKNPQSQNPLPLKKQIYEYDEDGNHLNTKHYSWVSFWESWEPGYKDEYIYDSKGLPTLRNRKKWELELQVFEDFQRMEYVYQEDKLIQLTVFTLKLISGWEEDLRFIYHYNDAGLLINEILYEHQSNDLWYGVRQKIFDYGEEGFLKREIVREVNPILLQWENVWEYNYIFEQGNLIESEKYSWHKSAEIWLEAELYTFEYDPIIQSEDIARPITSIASVNKLENSSTYFFDIEVEDYVLITSSNYYYSDLDVNTEDIKVNAFDLYPNPVSDQLTIRTNFNGGKYEIFTMDGNCLQSGLLKNAELIDVNSLSSGLYIMVIKNKNKFLSAKFIKN